MGGIWYSIPIKLSDEDSELVEMYCRDRGMMISELKRNNKDLPNLFYVWGTKKELMEFQKYF